MYSGKAVDIFAASTLTFTMLSQHPPFMVAHRSDHWYKYFVKNSTHGFWAKHEKNHPEGFYKQDFKSLFNAMVQADPVLRPTCLELLAHPWMQGPVPTFQEV